MASTRKKTRVNPIGSRLSSKQKSYYLNLYRENNLGLTVREFYAAIQARHDYHALHSGCFVPKLIPFNKSLSRTINKLRKAHILAEERKLKQESVQIRKKVRETIEQKTIDTSEDISPESVRAEALKCLHLMLKETKTRMLNTKSGDKVEYRDIKLVAQIYREMSDIRIAEEKLEQEERKQAQSEMIERRRLTTAKQIAEMNIASKRTTPINEADYQDATILEPESNELSTDFAEILHALDN